MGKSKQITVQVENEAELERIKQAEELLKEIGYVYDEKKGGWVAKAKQKKANNKLRNR